MKRIHGEIQERFPENPEEIPRGILEKNPRRAPEETLEAILKETPGRILEAVLGGIQKKNIPEGVPEKNLEESQKELL